MKSTEDLSKKRAEELAPYAPWVRFEIPSDKKSGEYGWWLCARLEECFTALDRRNQYSAEHGFPYNHDEEGGVGMIYVGKYFFIGCKLFWYDGTEFVCTHHGWKTGLLFRDHEDKSSYCVNGIFIVADAFAAFLREKKIPFETFVRLRADRKEISTAKSLV